MLTKRLYLVDMSFVRRTVLIIHVGILFSSAPALAQSGDTEDSADKDGAAAETGFVFDLSPVERTCSNSDLNATISTEIIVCAQVEDPGDFVLRCREEARNNYAARTMDVGNPQAPDLSPPPCVPSVISFCPKLGAPVPRSIETDFSKLPETPTGSDADRISKSLAPHGI
ncbi:hypothetical protein [Erythrobacter sp. QSSC1-22B]|uniref:hypothetical protein n=1 Tax=Erythrobacter sp. QSSC1-22B TaxID=1860125 RepID=UPI0011A59208|nr:hypothetical protein [Erythrobacter sp. QSSC1-22B]